MGRWRKEDHWHNLQIIVRHSLIGIEGIPLIMWNIHIFKVTRDACGVLLEVVEETMNKSFLGYAKLKVKGFGSGLMSLVIKILCEVENICLGAFSIRGPEGGVRGYHSAGAITRVVMSMRPNGRTVGAWIGLGNMMARIDALEGDGNKADLITRERTDALEGDNADVEARADKVALVLTFG